MSNLLGTVTVDVAFKDEIAGANDDIRGRLASAHYACSHPDVIANHCHEFVTTLMDLRDHLSKYFALEEAYGFFDDPEDVLGHKSYQSDQLREHLQLYSQFVELVERAETMLAGQDALLASSIPREFLAFHEQLMMHEQRENQQLLAIMDQDTGAGD